jgi:uncharacterized membrane protein YfcA
VELSAGLALAVVAAGVLAGILSALFGVGGGLLIVPFVVLVLGRDQHVAEATSLLVIVPTALAGTIAHVRNRYVSFAHAAGLALGGVAGVLAGATLALSTSPERLHLAFGVFLLAMGVRSVWKALPRRHKP